MIKTDGSILTVEIWLKNGRIKEVNFLDENEQGEKIGWSGWSDIFTSIILAGDILHIDDRHDHPHIFDANSIQYLTIRDYYIL